jgi:DNA-nicking Smr family endonuclease
MTSPKGDGAELWREVTRTVRPLARAQDSSPPARLHAPASRVPIRVVAPAHAPPPARAHAPPADRSPEKRVRRGRLEVAGRLDLHGMTQTEAQAALARFVAHHRAEGARVVLVVTGKGGRAGMGDGILKQRLPDWLGALRADVSGFAVAHAKHGGGGAFYIFLRARG